MDSVMPFTAPTPEGTSRWSKGPLTTTPYFITVILMLMLMIGALMVPSCVWEQLQPPPLLRHSVLALLVIAHGATKGVSRGVNKGVTTALSAALVAAAPLTSEAVQLPEASTLMRCDVQDGWNEWNGDSDAWECSGGVVTWVELCCNSLTGTLPASWSTITSVTYMGLNNNDLSLGWNGGTSNSLTGTLPASWSTMTNLAGMYLWNNGLTGTLPASWSTITSVTHMYLSANSLTGPLPTTWSTMTNVRSMNLRDNSLTGPLPASWSTMTKMDVMTLDGNNLDCGQTVPPALEGKVSGINSCFPLNEVLGACAGAAAALVAAIGLWLWWKRRKGAAAGGAEKPPYKPPPKPARPDAGGATPPLSPPHVIEAEEVAPFTAGPLSVATPDIPHDLTVDVEAGGTALQDLPAASPEPPAPPLHGGAQALDDFLPHAMPLTPPSPGSVDVEAGGTALLPAASLEPPASPLPGGSQALGLGLDDFLTQLHVDEGGSGSGRVGGRGVGAARHSEMADRLAHLTQGETVVGKFQVTATTRRGATSVVVHAISIATHRPVALKFFLREEDYEHERGLYTLLGPHATEALPEMLDFFPDSGDLPPVIAYEMGDETFTEWEKRSNPNDIKKKAALLDIGHCLSVLHKHRVAHLDIKPSNIMRFGTDFKLVDVGSWGEIGGHIVPTYTLRYCPPEMMQFAFKNKKAVVRAAMDVFSLGIVAFELLAGTRFHGDGAEEREIVEALLGVRPLPTDEGQPGLGALRTKDRSLLKKMLRRDVRTRPGIEKVVSDSAFQHGDNTTLRGDMSVMSSELTTIREAVMATWQELRTGALLVSVVLEEVLDNANEGSGLAMAINDAAASAIDSAAKESGLHAPGLKLQEVLLDSRSALPDTPVFKLRLGATYRLSITVTNADGGRPLPVENILSVSLSAAEVGVSLEMQVEEQSKWTLTCSGVWSMDELDAPGLRVPTRNRGRPAGDLVAVDLVAVFAMEPAGLPVEVRKQLHAEVYPRGEKFLVARAFKQGKEFWDNAPPWAKVAAKGMVFVIKHAAGV